MVRHSFHLKVSNVNFVRLHDVIITLEVSPFKSLTRILRYRNLPLANLFRSVRSVLILISRENSSVFISLSALNFFSFFFFFQYYKFFVSKITDTTTMIIDLINCYEKFNIVFA